MASFVPFFCLCFAQPSHGWVRISASKNGLFLVSQLAVENGKKLMKKLKSFVTTLDFILDEGSDGWTLLTIKNGGKHHRRRVGA